MKRIISTIVIFIFYVKVGYCNLNFKEIEHGFRIKINPKDQLGLKLATNDFELKSSTSLGYEFGYVVRTKGKLFVESGFSFVLNNLKYDIKINDPNPVFNTKSTFYDNYYYYNKLPLNLGYIFNFLKIPLQAKFGVNFQFLSSQLIKNSISNIENSTRVEYFSSVFDLNPNSLYLKSKSISLGYERLIFKKLKLITELTLEYTNSKTGKSYIEVFPNDTRNYTHIGDIKNKLNLGLDFSIIF